MKYFKMSKVKRFIILGVTLLASLLVIVLGSTLYLSKKENINKSIEYAGGAEYVVNIDPDRGVANKELATQVSNEIYDRLNSIGIKSMDVQPEIKDGQSSVRVVYSGVTTEEQKQDIENLITRKPKLTFLDYFGNPLFDEYGHFRTELNSSTSSLLPSSLEYLTGDKISYVPLQSNGSHSTFDGATHKVVITLLNDKKQEWTKATQYVKSLESSKHNQIFTWLDVKEFIQKTRKYPSIYNIAQENPNLAAYVNSNMRGPLRTLTVDANKYLISAPMVTKVLTGQEFVIEGKFTSLSSKILAQKINYGASHYKLKRVYSNFVNAQYGGNAFHKAVIAGLVVFSIIAIFLIVNYGLLGALSTISIALYVTITLSLFTVMRGEYSPEAIAALIIGVGMAVDANIITYERLKSEVYSGSSIQKGFKESNRKSLSTIFDANITTLIVAFVLFFFGTRNIIGMSVTLILSIMLTLIVMLGFTRFMATMLVKTGTFDNKQKWLGMNKEFDQKVQAKIDKVDYVKQSKWFVISSAVIFGVAIIVLSILAGLASNFASGFNLSQDFTGGAVLQLQSDTGTYISQTDIDKVVTLWTQNGGSSSDLSTISDGTGITSFKLISKDVDATINWTDKVKALSISNVNQSSGIYFSNTTNDVAKSLLKNAMIAIGVAIGAIILYTLIRFKWTYSIGAIIALVHDAMIVTSIFIITRVQISPIFIAGLLSIIGYSINDTIVTFDRVRENMHNHTGTFEKSDIKEIANKSIRETLKRSVLTSFTTLIAIIILMSFGNATKMSYNIAMFVGLIAGTYSSIFIATYLWTKLEFFRLKSISKRKENSFWEIKGIEEQTFKGINDFS